MKTGIIVLAAGESRRLGRPKQLVDWNGEPLLRHGTGTALAAELGGPVVVVLGAVDSPCREAIAGLNVTLVHNPCWQQGMGTSIAAGMQVIAGENLDGVIVMLCDQPLVTPHLLRALVEKSSDHPVVASHYHGQPGTPAWFAPAYFQRLASLEGKCGAKSLILAEAHRALVAAPEAGLDIDLPEDLVSFEIRTVTALPP